MASRAPRRPPFLLEEEIKKLKSELSELRYGVIQLVPDEFAHTLSGIFSCKSRDEIWAWKREAISKILKGVKPIPAREMGEYASLSDRALCPLCGSSSNNIHGAKGFAYPEGLTRHLEGSFNARQCFVVKVAADLALAHLAEQAEGPALNFDWDELNKGGKQTKKRR